MTLIWQGKRYDNKGHKRRTNELFYSREVVMRYYKKLGYKLFAEYPGVIYLSKNLQKDALPNRLSFLFDYSIADSWVVISEEFIIT